MRKTIAFVLASSILVIGALSLYEGWERPHSTLLQTGIFLALVARLVYRDKPAEASINVIDALSAATCLLGIVLVFTKY